MNLSDNLKKIRKDNNLSQEQLAEKLGVSRQSVSKWESNQAYPEMDKVIQICNMFNLNIDELLNQNIGEVKEKKESKNNVNKFIESFLNFITKTVDMFSSMKFKEKVKCLFEQIVVAVILIILIFVIGAILKVVINNVLYILPYEIYSFIYNVLAVLYLAFAVISGVCILLHIFKVRYLDYYVVVKGKVDEEKNIEEDNTVKAKGENKIYLEKKQEKIVIRDPQYSSYKFISVLLKCVLFVLKLFAIMISIGLIFSFVSLIVTLVVSFLFIKTGITFVGALFTIIGCIVINLIFLYIIYNFVFNKKCKKGYTAITFIISLACISIGIGMFIIGLKDFNYIEDVNNENYVETIINIDMNEKIIFNGYDEFEFIESDNSDIKVVCNHSKYSICKINNYDNKYYIHFYDEGNKFMDQIRDNISNINNKKIIDYSKTKVTFYTTKKNIDILKANIENYIKEMNDYNNRLDSLESELMNQHVKIAELEETINNKDYMIEELKQENKYLNELLNN